MTITYDTMRPLMAATFHNDMNAREHALWEASDRPGTLWSLFDFTGIRTGFLMGQIAFERYTRRNLRKRTMPSTDAILRVAQRSLISVNVETACRIELKTRERLQRLPKAVRREQHMARLRAKEDKDCQYKGHEIKRCWGTHSPSNP